MLERIAARAAVLVCALTLAACADAHASSPSGAPGVLALSTGRIGAIVGVLLGLTSAILGGLALARSAPHGRAEDGSAGDGGRRSIVALGAGVLGVALGGLVAATAPGGVGTGNGLGGAVVAMLVGLLGLVLNGLALARSRRAA